MINDSTVNAPNIGDLLRDTNNFSLGVFLGSPMQRQNGLLVPAYGISKQDTLYPRELVMVAGNEAAVGISLRHLPGESTDDRHLMRESADEFGVGTFFDFFAATRRLKFVGTRDYGKLKAYFSGRDSDIKLSNALLTLANNDIAVLLEGYLAASGTPDSEATVTEGGHDASFFFAQNRLKVDPDVTPLDLRQMQEAIARVLQGIN